MRFVVVVLGLLVAVVLGVAAEDVACDDCCASDACASSSDDEGASDECPPGCDDGCVCCARLTGMAPSTATRLPDPVAAPEVEHIAEADAAPTAPEPHGRDFVPRRSISAI